MKTKDKNKLNGYLGVVFCKSPKDYTFFDPRSAKPTYHVGEDNIVESSPGMVIQEVDNIKFNGSNVLEYFTPNNVGVLLSITNRSLTLAKDLFNKQIDPNSYNHTLKNVEGDRREALIQKSKIIYDFIEIIQTCIVFSYTSIEAFANLSIPDKYEYEQRIESKGIVEKYDKAAIERWLPLRQKISKILVVIYETEDITKKPIWNHFIKLEQYRHDIIHQKSIDRVEFYKNYFNKDIFKVCTSAEEIIDFFYKQHAKKNASNPLWPWLINKENHFPATKFKSENFEKRGSIYD
ncbi:hypothetical protein H7F15_06600 [Pontibacter sp. Tf4]|uniref:hypothetical protein n=1 Tax=Pontibacter sp. Tf4 TaxID=2761620 RepID=UPI001623EE74|nr:hypothetical protein [Pontibacter sp. Tf4]MBB6610700.1 hypothetical protein [Pontibacter sp. Tf4]